MPSPELTPLRMQSHLRTALIASGAAVAFVVGLFLAERIRTGGAGGGGCPSELASCAALARGFVSNESLADHLQMITVAPHIAGTPENMTAAALVEAELKRYGFKTHVVDFPALLGYPHSQSVTILEPQPQNLSLREASFPEDPYSQDPRASTPFLSYSPSGTVSAKVVYANFGTTDDFEELQSLGVSCKGSIVLMRYGAIYRGDKVANAAKWGAAGALIYSDPQQEAKEGVLPSQTFPSTRYLPPSGVQRGSIICAAPGDPRTPGWPSCPSPGCESTSKEELDHAGVLPAIPATPISYQNAAKILKLIGGPKAPEGWQGALPGVVYRMGPGPVEVALEVRSNITVATVRDVIGVLEGAEEPEKLVVLGNHRDAWVFGAADPNSGTTCLLEVARALQHLSSLGWRPRRTIVLASWDGEEHNLVGSTEWVEQNLPLLSTQAVAYLNVDVAVAGAGFYPAATPQLDDLVRYAASVVQDPDGPPGQSVLDSCKALTNATVPPVYRLGGGGSDFASFLQHAGIASTDFSFGGDYPMYHSLYDDFYWMSHFGDPLFKRHVASTQILLTLILNLTSEPILPFHYESYAAELQAYAHALNASLGGSADAAGVTAAPLALAVSALASAAEAIGLEAQGLRQALRSPASRAHDAAPGRLEGRLRSLNSKLMLAERGFLDPEGLGGNFTWYKHLVYGPVPDNGYATNVFPALTEALSAFLGSSPSSRSGHYGWEGAEGPFLSSRLLGGTAPPLRRRLSLSLSLGRVRRKSLASILQHEIHRAARAVTRAAAILAGQLH